MSARDRLVSLARGLARGALLGAAALAGACSQPPDTRPDLLLVVVDTLRADHLSAYGYARPTSPGLDALAASGVLFEDNLAQSSWTLPSIASMFTGRHVFVNAQRLPDRVPSLAERLRDAGYETAAFLGNPAVSALGAYDRGFDSFIGRETTGNVTWDADDLRGAVARWSESHPRTGKPRFLYLHFMDPHFPYEPRNPPAVAGKVELRDDTLSAWVSALKAAGPGTPLYDRFDEDRRHILEQIDRYDHEIATMDRSLAQILAEFGPAPGTAGRERLVVVAADHGETLWDHAHHAAVVAKKVPAEQRTLREVFFRDHSYHLYQELLHTPLIVAGAGFAPGQRIATPVENVDIVPTLLRAAGLPADPALDGRALQDVVAGVGRPRPVLYSFCNEGTAVRLAENGWKFIFPTPTGDSFGMRMQLYDLSRDTHERRDLVADSAAREILKKLLKLREDAAEAFRLYDDQDTESDAPEQNAVLRELGYVGGDEVPGAR
jgi:arylsulfatase A-like enzyme